MPIRIKNCGLTTADAVGQAIRTGASFLGFVHHAASPRHLEIPAMAALVASSSIQNVAVLVKPDDGLLHSIATQVKPDFIQLHGVEDAAHIQRIRTQYGIPIITAISPHSQNAQNIAALESVSAHMLFDAAEAGSGSVFDWQQLKTLTLQKSWFLAGGLNLGNVAEAMRVTRAPMVDISSGIESSRGVKSLEMIAAFNAAVLHASHA